MHDVTAEHAVLLSLSHAQDAARNWTLHCCCLMFLVEVILYLCSVLNDFIGFTNFTNANVCEHNLIFSALMAGYPDKEEQKIKFRN